jgi:UDP-N-acetylmuramoylalanine--D-glutamate ligase
MSLDHESRQAYLAARTCWDDVADASFTVFGLGKSGVAAANALARRGANVLAVDDKPESELAGPLSELDRRVSVQCGGGPAGRRGDLFILSPGIGPHTKRFHEIQTLAHAILSEVELFYRLDRAALDGRGHPIAAISGTDGKTTTTLLMGHLVRQAGLNAVVAGNIGDPLCDFLDTMGPDDVVVAEVSAFQLVTCSALRPRVAVVTNIGADHIDYFAGDTQAYIDTKLKVADRMGAGDMLLINGDDPELGPHRDRLAAGVPFAHAVFSTRGVPARGFGFEDGVMWWAPGDGARVAILPMAEFGSLGPHPITGLHNVENALGAVGMALALGIPLDAIRQGLRTFELPAHRMQPVGRIGGVRFIDDSKATNPHAAAAGLEAVQLAAGDRLVWIGGGSEKDADFAELGELVGRKAAAALLIGQTAQRIAGTLPPHLHVEHCERLEDCVPLGLQLTQGAGVVLLSPACASYDMFKSYAHRGDVFRLAVQALAQAMASRS